MPETFNTPKLQVLHSYLYNSLSLITQLPESRGAKWGIYDYKRILLTDNVDLLDTLELSICTRYDRTDKEIDREWERELKVMATICLMSSTNEF